MAEEYEGIEFKESSSQTVFVCSTVLEHITGHTQKSKVCNESGGQLFGKEENGIIYVFRATGPYKTDKRSRFSFRPNRTREQREINRFYSRGLHFLGDWHTHPEQNPTPSTIDLKNIQDCYSKSSHKHGGFLLLIIGTNPKANTIWLSIHNSKRYKRLIFQTK